MAFKRFLDFREFDRLKRRAEFLEEINRKYRQAMELLVSLGDLHRDENQNGNLSFHFASTQKFLKQLVDFQTVAFFMVDDEDMSFELAYCDPPSDRKGIRKAVDLQIENGNFAWALCQNRATILNDESSSAKMIFHALAGKTGVLGMFVGRVDPNVEKIPSKYLAILSNILGNAGPIIKNGILYSRVRARNRNLENSVRKRTRELERQDHELKKEICERRQMQSKIKHLTLYDTLTGLPNRNSLDNRLSLALDRARSLEKNLALIFVDIDNFKIVNESLGHKAGDLLLKDISKRLVQSLRRSDMIARVAGDKFVLLVQEVPDPEALDRIAGNIAKPLAQAFRVNNHEIFINLNMGVAMYPKDGDQPEALYKNAETAMGHAKKSGKNAHCHYSPAMHSQARQKISLETLLRKALELNEFFLHYQPKIDLRTGALAGMEALLRLDRQGVGLISPGEFIPFAEESRLILPIGEWVIRTACEQAKTWERMGFPSVKIAINLSGRQCNQNDLIDVVRKATDETKVDLDRLEFEITETVLMENSGSSLARLRALNEMGISLTIDDFGIGYSSLSYLKNLPIQTVKIDQSFINGLSAGTDAANPAIIRAIISMARSLGLKTVAEGVEHMEDMEFLRGAGCDSIQGYYVSRPLPADAMTAYLAKT
ncbi:MAG: EAL domain-containing protein [Nitrospinae bacterium]|nr:EAL domain-containing protein [Nitrospinota bacterium]